MLNARELFNEIFDDFIHYGNPTLSGFLDYNSNGKQDWFHYIWGDNHSTPDNPFLVRILHYFSLEQQDDREEIIKRLETEAEKYTFIDPSENDSDHIWIYTLLLSLDQVLHAESSEQIHKAAQSTEGFFIRLLNAYESAIGNTYQLTGDYKYLSDPHALFLRKTAEFMFSLSPEIRSCAPLPFDDDCAYHAVLLYTCNKYTLPLSSPDQHFQKALDVRDSRMYYRATQDAYELSLKNNDPQTTYDILYSWLHQKSCGPITYHETQHSHEDQWRKKHPELVAHLQSSMSLLCARLSNLHDKSTHQSRIFRSKAIRYAKGVLEDRHFKTFDYRRNIAVLLETRKYGVAARIAAELSDEHPDNVYYPIAQLSAKIGTLCQPSKGKRSIAELFQGSDTMQALTELVRQLNEKADDNDSDSLFEENRQIYSISRKCGSIKDGESIAVLLLFIRHLSIQIKHELQYTGHLQTKYLPRDDDSKRQKPPVERKPYTIAYYTTLSNLKYLMEPVYTEDPMGKPVPLKDLKETVDPQQAKNCLTMMHAHYMNDPSEGITLPEALSDCIDQNSSSKNLLFLRHTPSVFREQLLDQSFVFLKSFTNIVDQLNMWSMYASDRSGGSDSNGCCVCIAPETFEMMLRPSWKMSEFEYDDMPLYKVAYLRNNNIVNRDQPDLNHYFRLLKESVQALNDILAGQSAPSRQLLESAVSTLQQILTPIIFLFKDASYRAEHELRLIVTRSREKEDMERISKTPQDPPKLYVNPYHQVFVDQIILGPKVNQPDNWIPHLQFELTKMWEKWPAKNGEKRVPSVRKSSINYRD